RGRQDEAAAFERRLFAGGGPGEALVAGGEADGAHEGRGGDADAGQAGGDGPAVGHVPAHDERFGEDVAQEPEAGYLDGVAVAVGLDLQDLDLQQVAGLGALDVDGPGERVDDVEVGGADRLQRGLGPHLAVERVARLHDDLVAGSHAEDGRDVGM